MLCTGSANGHALQSFKVFFQWQNNFFSICSPVATRSQTGKNDYFFFKNVDPHNSRLFSPKQRWFVAVICLIWMLMEYKNGHSPDASIILTF